MAGKQNCKSLRLASDIVVVGAEAMVPHIPYQTVDGLGACTLPKVDASYNAAKSLTPLTHMVAEFTLLKLCFVLNHQQPQKLLGRLGQRVKPNVLQTHWSVKSQRMQCAKQVQIPQKLEATRVHQGMLLDGSLGSV